MLPLPLVEGGVLGLLRMPLVSELLAPELEFMPLEPELERELLRSRSRQVWSSVPVIPWHTFGMELDVPDEDVLGERVEEDPDEPMEPELLEPDPMLDPPGVAPLEPPMPPELPVPCAQANCASARAETAHAFTSIREVVPICNAPSVSIED